MALSPTDSSCSVWKQICLRKNPLSDLGKPLKPGPFPASCCILNITLLESVEFLGPPVALCSYSHQCKTVKIAAFPFCSIAYPLGHSNQLTTQGTKKPRIKVLVRGVCIGRNVLLPPQVSTVFMHKIGVRVM